jgi:hypothetical protein
MKKKSTVKSASGIKGAAGFGDETGELGVANWN